MTRKTSYKLTPFGQKIREIRTRRRYGLRATAYNLDISPAYLSRLETGSESCSPSEKVIWKIATLFSIKPYILFALAGKIPKIVIEYICENPDLLNNLIIHSSVNKCVDNMAKNKEIGG